MTINCLYTEDEIRDGLKALAPQIVARLGKTFTVVPVLTGGFVFAADLCRALYRVGADPEIDFLQLASYGNERESSGEVRIVKDLTATVEDQIVLIVDDVLDSGRSIHFARQLLLDRGAANVVSCVAIAKDKVRDQPVDADFALFRTGGEAFLVGYGMDDAGMKRALPEISTLD